MNPIVSGLVTFTFCISISNAYASPTQCQKILEKSWAAAKPAIAKLGIKSDETLEKRYLTDQNFLSGCDKLTQDKKNCLENAENPLVAITSCNVNRPNQILSATDFSSLINLWPSTPLSPKDASDLTKGIVGTWSNEWAQYKQSQKWVIGPNGKIKSASVARNGKPDPQAQTPEQISFSDTGQVAILWKGTTTRQFHTFFKESKDVFYTSSNTLYVAYPVKNEKKFVIRDGWDHIVYDSGKCEVISTIAATFPAKCEFTREGNQRVFKTTYTLPGAARPNTFKHFVIGNHFLTEALVETGKFVRQK